jgi:hypothetical protein
MCENCFSEVDKFPSYVEEREFHTQLIQKLDLGKVELVRRSVEYKGDFHDIYKCLNCKTVWWISLAENAWRGYCLTESHAKQFIENYKKSGQDKRYGCLVFLFVLFILIILSFFNK